MNYVSKMPFADKTKVPAPFPGDSPTRIAWEIELRRRVPGAKSRIETYIGKPSKEQVTRLHNLLQPKGRRYHEWDIHVTCVEFDRKHVLIHQAQSVWEDEPVIPVENKVSLLWSAYHPWQVSMLWLEFFKNRNFIKNIGGFRVYAIGEKLKLEYVNKYKEWMLQNCGKQLVSAEERKAARMAKRAELAKAREVKKQTFYNF